MSPRIRSVEKPFEPFDARWSLSPGDYRQHHAHIPFDEADENRLRSLQARAAGCTPAAPPLPPAKAMPARKNAARKATKKRPGTP